jgi:ABC-type sugar transport system ATPase subunit
MYARNLENNEVEEIKNVSEFARNHNLNRVLISHRLNNIIDNKVLGNWEFYRK